MTLTFLLTGCFSLVIKPDKDVALEEEETQQSVCHGNKADCDLKSLDKPAGTITEAILPQKITIIIIKCKNTQHIDPPTSGISWSSTRRPQGCSVQANAVASQQESSQIQRRPSHTHHTNILFPAATKLAPSTTEDEIAILPTKRK